MSNLPYSYRSYLNSCLALFACSAAFGAGCGGTDRDYGSEGSGASTGAGAGTAGKGSTSSGGSGGDSDGEGGDGPSGAGTSGTGNNGEAGANDGQGGTNDDETPPEIVSVSPEGDGVEGDSPLEIVFSEPMNTASGLAVSLESEGAPVELSEGVWSEDDTILTLEPTSPLVYATGLNANLPAREYTVKIDSSATDRAGNALASEFVTTFSTLRQIETVIAVVDQHQYFAAEGEYSSGPGTTFYVRRQVGGTGYEDQYDFGLVVFDKSDSELADALAEADTYALELYANTTVTGAEFTVAHINANNLESTSTPWSSLVTTSVTLDTFPAAQTWWSIDVRPLFEHANFNLASYNSLQLLLSIEVPGGTDGDVRTIEFRGGTHATHKPRLRFTRLVP